MTRLPPVFFLSETDVFFVFPNFLLVTSPSLLNASSLRSRRMVFDVALSQPQLAAGNVRASAALSFQGESWRTFFVATLFVRSFFCDVGCCIHDHPSENFGRNSGTVFLTDPLPLPFLDPSPQMQFPSLDFYDRWNFAGCIAETWSGQQLLFLHGGMTDNGVSNIVSNFNFLGHDVTVEGEFLRCESAILGSR